MALLSLIYIGKYNRISLKIDQAIVIFSALFYYFIHAYRNIFIIVDFCIYTYTFLSYVLNHHLIIARFEYMTYIRIRIYNRLIQPNHVTYVLLSLFGLSCFNIRLCIVIHTKIQHILKWRRYYFPANKTVKGILTFCVNSNNNIPNIQRFGSCRKPSW